MGIFFGERVLLSSPASYELYQSVKDLPIIDYHCHLDEKAIKEDRGFSDIGELWLSSDHYKWRAMRLCGVDEKYITGDADYKEKYIKFAEIFPKLCGNPLYYWTQMELKMLFGINEPLSTESANRIYDRANELLKDMKISDILKKFNVEYIATTDSPVSPLQYHGRGGTTLVSPTYRPDAILNMEKTAISELEGCVGYKFDDLSKLKKALSKRLEYFVSHSCCIADHGMEFLPECDCGERVASELFGRREHLNEKERQMLNSHLLSYLFGLYKSYNITVQLHFATMRNVNSKMYEMVGRDAGFDIMRGNVDVDKLAVLFDMAQRKDNLPKVILYSLNPYCVPAIAALSGAFPNIRIGTAWWFNDTLLGIRRQLETIAEYSTLGTHLGMLTDSRSFSSYVRFDFFRRILADLVGDYVTRGEYSKEHAEQLMYDISYGNIKAFLGI